MTFLLKLLFEPIDSFKALCYVAFIFPRLFQMPSNNEHGLELQKYLITIITNIEDNFKC